MNARTVQLVKLLSEVGPDVPEISRRLGQFKESVRYRYKEKILNKGFAVQAAVDHERLGLKRVILVADFAEPYVAYAPSIFAAMNELCYVISFAKVMVGGQYVVNVSAPVDSIEQVRSFFQDLKEKGMFTSLEIMEFDWFRNAPMKAEFYDFDTGRWDFDWGEQGATEFEAAAYLPSDSNRFDSVDLLIIKELQMDANKSLKEISDKLSINYKKLAWHYTTHVQDRHLVRGYTVNWMGTRYDYNIEKVLHRKHRYFAVDLLVKDVSDIETMTLRQRINRLPFLWAEAAGKNYFAEFAFPVDFAVEGLQYLGSVTNSIKGKTEVHAIDQTAAARFTVSYKLFDQQAKRWTFDSNDLSERFGNLIMQIKSGTG